MGDAAMQIANDTQLVKSISAGDFQEHVGDGEYGRPRTNIAHMQVLATGNATNLAHNLGEAFTVKPGCCKLPYSLQLFVGFTRWVSRSISSLLMMIVKKL